jgi:hypothetical protein
VKKLGRPQIEWESFKLDKVEDVDGDYAIGYFTFRHKGGEEVQISAPVYRDPGGSWHPMQELTELYAAAKDELARIREGPARDGKAWRDGLRKMRERKDPDHDKRLAEARRCADAIRKQAPGVYWTRKGMLNKISVKSGIPFGTLRDWADKGDLELKLEPDE